MPRTWAGQRNPQALSAPCAAGRRTGRSHIHRRGSGPAPVSYTHLDVYKRQDNEDLVADEACHFDPALDGHAKDHGPDAGEKQSGNHACEINCTY